MQFLVRAPFCDQMKKVKHLKFIKVIFSDILNNKILKLLCMSMVLIIKCY